MARLAAVLVALLILPGASAAWRGVGTLEPDVAADATERLMFPDPDTSAGAPAVYLDGYVAVEQLTLNPNVGLLGSRVLMPGAAHQRVILGLWKDCNADGYIGQAEGALQDYSSALISPAICPVGSMFNDGQWVSEMIMVGMVDPCEQEPAAVRAAECGGINEFQANPRVLYAPGTMVWADVGAPGEVPPAECVTTRLPRGATASTGGLVGAIDCQLGRAIATGVNAADEEGALGLRFEDKERPDASTSLLNQPLPVTPFGGPAGPGLLEAESGSRSFTVWDCSAPKGGADVANPLPADEAAIEDPTGSELSGRRTTIFGPVVVFADEDGDAQTPGVRRIALADEEGSLAWVPAPAPSVDDPAASSWDALEAAADGPRGDCSDATPGALRAANPQPFLESRDDAIAQARKDRVSFAFTFYDGHRGLNDTVDPTTGANAPSDGGLVYRRNDRGGDGPFWSADAASVQEPQLVNRREIGAQGPIRFTYYARLGPEALVGTALPGAREGLVYGAIPCGTSSDPVGGWVCDPSQWWRGPAGEDARPYYSQGEVPYAPVPGDVYHLRDIDCYDGQLARGQPVYASLALLAPSQCA